MGRHGWPVGSKTRFKPETEARVRGLIRLTGSWRPPAEALEWLMGFPTRWSHTEYEHSETPSYPQSPNTSDTSSTRTSPQDRSAPMPDPNLRPGLRAVSAQPAEGAHLLDELSRALTSYVVLPSPEAVDAVVLWIAATHVQPAWEHATRLGIVAPEKRCGKSRLLDIVAETCHERFITVNANVAALYRSIDETEPPTLLFDEVDAIFGGKRGEDHEDLRALLNAGHGRGRPVLRCVGPNHDVAAFPSFAMAALAGIGNLPDTIADRAVNIRMRRRAPGESVRPFRQRRDGTPLNELRDRLHTWARRHVNALTAAEPDMPVEDRAADTWESLIAIADQAGGTWPQRSRAAALSFVAQAAQADTEGSLNTRLLSDVRDAFTETGASFLASAELLARLHRVEEAPWADIELTMRKLSKRLGEYSIRPRPNTTRTARGYHLADCLDPFTRYLPAPEASGSVQASGSAVNTGADQQEHTNQPPDTSQPYGHFEVSSPKQVSA
jgi:hypothetical protein